jgi:hypothetical protein
MKNRLGLGMEYASPLNWLVRVHGGISHQNSEKFKQIYGICTQIFFFGGTDRSLVRPNQSWIYTLYIYYACQSASWVRGLVWNPTMSDFQDTVPDLWQLFMLYFWNLLLKSGKFKDLISGLSAFHKFHCRYNDLIHYYKLSLSHLLSDIFHTNS